jgi:hypothetical protein
LPENVFCVIVENADFFMGKGSFKKSNKDDPSRKKAGFLALSAKMW